MPITEEERRRKSRLSKPLNGQYSAPCQKRLLWCAQSLKSAQHGKEVEGPLEPRRTPARLMLLISYTPVGICVGVELDDALRVHFGKHLAKLRQYGLFENVLSHFGFINILFYLRNHPRKVF